MGIVAEGEVEEVEEEMEEMVAMEEEVVDLLQDGQTTVFSSLVYNFEAGILQKN